MAHPICQKAALQASTRIRRASFEVALFCRDAFFVELHGAFVGLAFRLNKTDEPPIIGGVLPLSSPQ
jgi:hypothetical protein